jgi:hypothetical protein
MPDDEVEALREIAREQVEKMPAETALGNRDPEGGGEGTPQEYEQEHKGLAGG